MQKQEPVRPPLPPGVKKYNMAVVVKEGLDGVSAEFKEFVKQCDDEGTA